ncbi:uncharacterized protein EV422DRAFT_172844 [Fimicolochytrium jonesii]|uniref:uncharacterized protein n=1 Tax=Fimicolochytrium jonesii TaxID=1396493 RepID=UPI0022FF14F9|nr:uncharacterized protein EV422DRAFT_172844 [Fimicolochytrium jonesii]KAI8818583.1 hypothetical protein EV422DRAFT_172844 [Fimicolochytrium jonesii]
MRPKSFSPLLLRAPWTFASVFVCWFFVGTVHPRRGILSTSSQTSTALEIRGHRSNPNPDTKKHKRTSPSLQRQVLEPCDNRRGNKQTLSATPNLYIQQNPSLTLIDVDSLRLHSPRSLYIGQPCRKQPVQRRTHINPECKSLSNYLTKKSFWMLTLKTASYMATSSSRSFHTLPN